MKIAIIVHGGAGRIPEREHEAHRAGCRQAAILGYQVLAEGGTALEAVEKAVTLMEDDPAFDAGIGSHLNQAGVVELDAGIMEGATLRVGALAGVERLQNPIQVARALLNNPHSFFVSSGAEEWAERQGFPLIEPAKLIVEREQRRYEKRRRRAEAGDGTVGAVAIDRAGNLVAGTSTGGMLFKPVGRVGDSPLPGCGYHADNRSAGVSCTGHGEPIIRLQLARTAADLAATMLSNPSPDSPFLAAAETAVRLLRERVNGEGGLIMIDRIGRVGWAYNTPHMARAYLTEGLSEPVVNL